MIGAYCVLFTSLVIYTHLQLWVATCMQHFQAFFKWHKKDRIVVNFQSIKYLELYIFHKWKYLSLFETEIVLVIPASNEGKIRTDESEVGL